MLLKQRRRLPEIMDDPSLDSRRHLQALRGLERINRLSRSLQIVYPPIKKLAIEIHPKPLRILDIATGAGDLPIALLQQAHRDHLHLQADGCDLSPRAVDYARTRAKEAKTEAGFFELDLFVNALPTDYDVVMASLFLHHIENEQAVALLRRMGQAARRLVLMNDLVRSVRGLALAYLGTRLLSACDVVHQDGPKSVQAAYTLDEVRSLSIQAGLEGAAIVHRWPCRFLLAWRRP